MYVNFQSRITTPSSAAFSLLEMMAVISFFLILASFSMPIYRTMMIRTREAKLREELFTLRAQIDRQGRGIGAALLRFLVERATGPLLVGTWAAAAWAISFYQRHGFQLVSPEEKDRLLTAYWNIPARQKETSVVLVSMR